MRKLKWFYLILPVLIVFLGVIFVLKLNEIINRPVAIEQSLPVMKIYLNDVTLDEVRDNGKEVKYQGNKVSFVDGKFSSDYADVEIKGRGNSTWVQPKIPLQIKFKDKVNLLGLGARRKYILLANYLDYSFIRNDAMFKLAEMIDEKYRCRGEFIDLYIDDDYQGLYYLTTKIELDKNSVDLRDKYGVLFELDTLHIATEDCYKSQAGECLVLKDAVFEDDEKVLDEAVNLFINDFNQLEIAAKRGDFDTVSEIIDVRSFAEYFLISEFGVNPDAHTSSFNLYKDGEDDKIHAGPLWDFDYAFGNRNWNYSVDEWFYSPRETTFQRRWYFSPERGNTDTRKLLYYLIDIPEFKAEVDKVFQEKLSGRKRELEMYLLKKAHEIEESALKDEDKWREESRFYEEVKYLLKWIDERYDYFEENYGDDSKKTCYNTFMGC